jgi:prevent-host-death family protein
METVSIQDAETQLSRLVDQAAAGEEIIIAREGKPVAKLVPLTPRPAKRNLGILAGNLAIPADFDAPLPQDVLDAFEGR